MSLAIALLSAGTVWLIFFAVMKFLEFTIQQTLYSFMDTYKISMNLGYLGWETTALISSTRMVGPHI